MIRGHLTPVKRGLPGPVFTSMLHYTHTLDWIHANVMRRAYNEVPRVKVRR